MEHRISAALAAVAIGMGVSRADAQQSQQGSHSQPAPSTPAVSPAIQEILWQSYFQAQPDRDAFAQEIFSSLFSRYREAPVHRRAELEQKVAAIHDAAQARARVWHDFRGWSEKHREDFRRSYFEERERARRELAQRTAQFGRRADKFSADFEAGLDQQIAEGERQLKMAIAAAAAATGNPVPAMAVANEALQKKGSSGGAQPEAPSGVPNQNASPAAPSVVDAPNHSLEAAPIASESPGQSSAPSALPGPDPQAMASYDTAPHTLPSDLSWEGLDRLFSPSDATAPNPFVNMSPSPEQHQYLSEHGRVELCTRPADLWFNAGGVIPHDWIKVPGLEAGLGPRGGGVPGRETRSADMIPYYTQTTVNSHNGQSTSAQATCVPVEGINEICVRDELEIGKAQGRWTPFNTCLTFVKGVLDRCRANAQVQAPSEKVGEKSH